MHRDLKIANVFKHNGLIKLGDFGFSKIMLKQEMATTFIGTPINMAP